MTGSLPPFGNNMLYTRNKVVYVAEGGFDPPTSGLWAQHASSAPLCYRIYEARKVVIVNTMADAIVDFRSF